MNLTGYLLGNRTGYRLANRVGYLAGFGLLTDSLTKSGGESPHVRAIASRPVPSRPFQTCPDHACPSIPTREDLSDNCNSPIFRTSRRRACARGGIQRENVEAHT